MKRSWFRVLVDAEGKAVDCRPVSDEGTAERGVFYILASSAAEAAKAANNAHCAKLLAARRARYSAEGLCKCGRARDRVDTTGAPMKVCSGCIGRHKVHDERKKARDRGEEVPPLDRREVLQQRKESDANAIRFALLVEVQNLHRRLPREAFERWLCGQFERLTKKSEAA